jgi:prophage maintenance system killer protein
VGLACGLAFLRLNGVRLAAGDDDLVELVIGVAEGRVSKADVAVFLRKHAKRRPPSRR